MTATAHTLEAKTASSILSGPHLLRVPFDARALSPKQSYDGCPLHVAIFRNRQKAIEILLITLVLESEAVRL